MDQIASHPTWDPAARSNSANKGGQERTPTAAVSIAGVATPFAPRVWEPLDPSPTESTDDPCIARSEEASTTDTCDGENEVDEGLESRVYRSPNPRTPRKG
jgi:hypothetical protein